jgi:hypothetical protein
LEDVGGASGKRKPMLDARASPEVFDAERIS